MKRRLLFIILIAVFSAFSVTSAQDEPSPFLQMLQLVPDEMHGDLYFNDYAAIEQAYAPAQIPADWSEFDALSGDTAAEMFPIDVWWRVFMNIQSPLGQYFMTGDEMPASMGIDFFQIDRSLVNTAPPHTVTYLQGEFDVDAVRSALTEREFTQQTTDSDLELWCGAVGCENSMQQNLEQRLVSDLFGGDLGRQWGRFIASDLLVGANFIEDLQAVGETLTGDEPSLAEDGRHHAAVEAVSDQGVLLQALIPSFENTLAFYDTPFLFDPRLTREQFAAVIDMMLEDYETLPAFDLIMFVDIVSDTEQIAEIVLVYSSEEVAEQAIPVLLDRIENYQSVRVRRMLTDLIEERRATVTADVVNVDNWSVVRLKLSTPKATPEEIVQFRITLSPDELPDVTQAGFLYRLLMDSYVSRDMGWLSLVTREELEGLASGS